VALILEPIDLPFLVKTPGRLRDLEIAPSAECIRQKGKGGPQSYKPLLARLGRLSSGHATLESILAWAGESGVEEFRPHLKAGALGFASLFEKRGGRWIPIQPAPVLVSGQLLCSHGVKAVWLHKDFRRACFVNLRNTFIPSEDALSFLLRACFETYVRDEPNISEACVVDVSRFAEVGSNVQRTRRANVFTADDVPMMSLDEYEFVLRRFWMALEVSKIVAEGQMPMDIVGTMFARPAQMI
jgi:hypothetical protein